MLKRVLFLMGSFVFALLIVGKVVADEGAEIVTPEITRQITAMPSDVDKG